MSPPPADDGQSAAVVWRPEPSESEPSDLESEPSESVGLPNVLDGEQGIEDDCTKETGLTHESTVSFISQSKGPNIKLESGIDDIKVESGIDLAPMGNLVTMVNKNLSNCVSCKRSRLELVPDRRVGFATNWKLTCKSCKKTYLVLRNNLNYLKRSLDNCPNFTARRRVMQKNIRKRAIIQQRKKHGTSAHP